MDTPEKPTNYLENALFVFLGALCAVVMSLGTFGVAEDRGPASFETSTVQNADFDARVYMGE